jgi:hypothetical protein
VGQVEGGGVSETCPNSRAPSSPRPAPALTSTEGFEEWTTTRTLSKGQLPQLLHAQRQRLPRLQLWLLRAQGRRWCQGGHQPARRSWAHTRTSASGCLLLRTVRRLPSPPPPASRPHLPGGVGAAQARGARFPQGATLGLGQEALAVQRGFDKAGIAVELHQVEDLRGKQAWVARGQGDARRATCIPGRVIGQATNLREGASCPSRSRFLLPT